MKINFITRSPHAACSQFYSEAFKKGIPDFDITFYDMSMRGQKYDVVLLMTYDTELVSYVRERQPTAKIGIIDPRSDDVRKYAEQANFLIVDSIEMLDYWADIAKPIIRYNEYPDIPVKPRQTPPSDRLVVGYHGNKVHLESAAQTLTPALSVLSQVIDKPVEFKVVYSTSFTDPLKSDAWYPDNCNVNYQCWTPTIYHDFLADCHIGVVPNNLPAESKPTGHASWNYKSDDYSLRFKMPSNSGRAIIFGLLGIPVITDFYPSGIEIITASHGGMCASSSGGWLKSLIVLASENINTQAGSNLQNYVVNHLNFEKQNKFLSDALKLIVK